MSTIGLVFLTPSTVQSARWYEDYELAVEHIEAGQCSAQAIEALGAAVVDKSKPKRGVKTYAQRRIDYLPYFQLARAHLLCGNTDLAQQYLERSRNHGVAHQEELGPVEAGVNALLAIQRAEPTVPPVDEEELNTRLKAARQSLETAREALKSTDRALAGASGLTAGNPQWSSRREAGATSIDKLDAGLSGRHESNNLLALADAASSGAEVARTLDALTAEINNRAAEDRRAALAPTPTSPIAVAEARSTPTRASVRTETVPTPAPLISNDLRTAAAAYLSGSYDSVTTILDRVSLDDTTAQAAALLIRGAAHLSLATLEEDPAGIRTHTEAAKADILASRELNPEIHPDPVFFPPPVVELFNAERPQSQTRPEEDP